MYLLTILLNLISPVSKKFLNLHNVLPNKLNLLFSIKQGEWQTHRFDNETWHEKGKPFATLKQNRINISHADNSEDESEEDSKEYEEIVESYVLTDDMIKTSLSYLERSPIVFRYVLCKCVLSHMVR